VALARAVNGQKPLHPLAVAKIHQGDAGLLLELAAPPVLRWVHDYHY